MLGDILSNARRHAADVEQLLEASDRQLHARIADAAAVENTSFGGFVRMAVADFGQFATEEDWTTLMAHLRDSGVPGATCLIAMLKWRLAAAEITMGSALSAEKEPGHA